MFTRQDRSKLFPLDYQPTVVYDQGAATISASQLQNLSILFDNTNVTSSISISDLIPSGGLMFLCVFITASPHFVAVLDANLKAVVKSSADQSSNMVTLALKTNNTEVGTKVQWWSCTTNFYSSVNQSSFKIFVISQPVPVDVFAQFNQGL